MAESEPREWLRAFAETKAWVVSAHTGMLGVVELYRCPEEGTDREDSIDILWMDGSYSFGVFVTYILEGGMLIFTGEKSI